MRDPQAIARITGVPDLDCVDVIVRQDLVVVTALDGIHQYRYLNGSLESLSIVPAS